MPAERRRRKAFTLELIVTWENGMSRHVFTRNHAPRKSVSSGTVAGGGSPLHDHPGGGTTDRCSTSPVCAGMCSHVRRYSSEPSLCRTSSDRSSHAVRKLVVPSGGAAR